MTDYYYECGRCQTKLSGDLKTGLDQLSMWCWCEKCDGWVMEEDLVLKRVPGEDLGYCRKCNRKMCYTLDGYFGMDTVAKHLCKACRHRYERSIGV